MSLRNVSMLPWIMLTEDESIVDVPVTVQYNIAMLKILYWTWPSRSEFEDAADSALRHVVVLLKLIRYCQRGVARSRLRCRKDYSVTWWLGAGINIVGVNIQEGKPPAAVKDAFDDVVKAKEDQKDLKTKPKPTLMVLPEVTVKPNALLKRPRAIAIKWSLKLKVKRNALINCLLNTVKPLRWLANVFISMRLSQWWKIIKVFIDVEGGNNMLYLPW